MESFFIGLLLAICSTILIGFSFVIKKKGLIRLSLKGIRAGYGGYGYLKEWMWWLGMILMAAGEVLNFVAYSFAPATLVTPLGAISVLVTAIASSFILSEHLNILGKLGCVLCFSGAINIILNAPQENSVKTFSILKNRLCHQGFIMYSICAFLFVAFMIFYVAPKWGHKTPLVYVLITGILGSLTVITCKGLGVAVLDLFVNRDIIKDPIFWAMILFVSIFIALQLTFLNRALDIFNVSVVTPILYVVFTTFVLISSAIVFTEFAGQTFRHQLGLVSGLVTVIVGIFLINSFQTVVIRVQLTDLFSVNNKPKCAFITDESVLV